MLTLRDNSPLECTDRVRKHLNFGCRLHVNVYAWGMGKVHLTRQSADEAYVEAAYFKDTPAYRLVIKLKPGVFIPANAI